MNYMLAVDKRGKKSVVKAFAIDGDMGCGVDRITMEAIRCHDGDPQ